MKIYSFERSASKELKNLGAKIDLDKLSLLLNASATIILRAITGEIQRDIRIRKVPEIKKKDRGIKILKAYYVLLIETGKKGFETFSPKTILSEESYKFKTLDNLLNFLEANRRINRKDWIMDSNIKDLA